MSWHGFRSGGVLHVRYVDERKNMSKKKKKLQKKVKEATKDLESSVSDHWPVTLAIAVECDDLKSALIDQNRAAGNASFEPEKVFSDATVVERLLVRIDEHLARLVKGYSVRAAVEKDLLECLLLLRIARRFEAEAREKSEE